MKVGRNDPCHCGSGKKYKKCHQAQDEAARSAELAKEAAAKAAAAATETEEGEGEDTYGKPRAGRDAPQPPPKMSPTAKASPIRRRAV